MHSTARHTAKRTSIKWNLKIKFWNFNVIAEEIKSPTQVKFRYFFFFFVFFLCCFLLFSLQLWVRFVNFFPFFLFLFTPYVRFVCAVCPTIVNSLFLMKKENLCRNLITYTCTMHCSTTTHSDPHAIYIAC